MRLYKHYINIY